MSGGRRGVRICRERIKSTGTIAPDDLDLGWVILHRENKRVKFNGTPIITSKTACGNKALNNLRRNENIVKHKGITGIVQIGTTNGCNGKKGAIANNNVRVSIVGGALGDGEDTSVRRHMRSST